MENICNIHTMLYIFSSVHHMTQDIVFENVLFSTQEKKSF
jgi:hypothetical protein